MNNKDLFIREDLLRAVFIPSAPWLMSRKQYNSSHAYKVARPAPLSTAIPKKPSRSEATIFDQMNSGKHTKRKKTTFLHFGVLRKRIRLRDEKQFASISDQRDSSPPSSYTLYRGRIKFLRTILTHKKLATRNQIISSNRSNHQANCPRQ